MLLCCTPNRGRVLRSLSSCQIRIVYEWSRPADLQRLLSLQCKLCDLDLSGRPDPQATVVFFTLKTTVNWISSGFAFSRSHWTSYALPKNSYHTDLLQEVRRPQRETFWDLKNQNRQIFANILSYSYHNVFHSRSRDLGYRIFQVQLNLSFRPSGRSGQAHALLGRVLSYLADIALLKMGI